MDSPGATLRAQLSAGGPLVVPGAANALAARVIAECGFDAIYVTGAGIANTYLGARTSGW
jgi:2-methylisocitrate lyase-like PEP mutase family enzyme